MKKELEQDIQKWFKKVYFHPAAPSIDCMPYGYDMNYIESLRKIIGKYIKQDYDIVKGYGDFSIEIRLKGIQQNNFKRSDVQQLLKD